jgi:hypothetical protein
MLVAVGVLACASFALASSISNFQQEITSGTLAIDIVDASYDSVSSPSVSMGSETFSFACNTSTGTFGSATEQIYVSNPDAADNGWTATLAGHNATSVWDSAGTDMDFNDEGGGGCTDGSDDDSLAGLMYVDPSGASLAQGASGNGTDGVSLGSASHFNEGTTNSITIVSSNGTTDIGDWTVQDVSISQTIPPEQPAADDYDINMMLSVQAV